MGGGSTYTPELIDGFARLRDTLPISELVLIDPAADRLELVGGLARRIFARQGHDGRIVTTSDVDAGVEDADAVLLQLRVGGQAARNQDETWPLECGCVGQETTGAGGLAKALRTVPVVLDIAERVRRTNPNAWIIDFTNPVGIVTRALLQALPQGRGPVQCRHRLPAQVRGPPRSSRRRPPLEPCGPQPPDVGDGVRLGGPEGADVLPKLLAEHSDAIADDLRLPRAVLDRLGVVPSYYLRYFYAHDEVVRELKTKPSRAAEVAEMEKQLLKMYGDPALDTKPELLAKRGGAFYSEAAVDLAASLIGRGGSPYQVVNTVNNGTLSFLPDDAVIEVQAAVGARGATPLPVPELDPLYAGLITHVTAYEDLALEAALRGGRDRVFKALLSHPLIGQYEYADALTDKLIAHNQEHLAWA